MNLKTGGLKLRQQGAIGHVVPNAYARDLDSEGNSIVTGDQTLHSDVAAAKPTAHTDSRGIRRVGAIRVEAFTTVSSRHCHPSDQEDAAPEARVSSRAKGRGRPRVRLDQTTHTTSVIVREATVPSVPTLLDLTTAATHRLKM